MMNMRWLCVLLFVGSAVAQSPEISGDFSGMLGPLHLKLHLKGSGSALEGTLDSVDQGARGLACSDIRLDGNSLVFDVPSVGGKWHGTVSDDRSQLTGTWSQGQDIPLVLRRDEPFAAAEKPSKVDGIWLGTLEASGAKLRIQLQVKSDRAGKEHCSLDSLDQGSMGLACDKVQLAGDQFSFDLPAVHGHFSGTLGASGNELNGTWSQGRDLPLHLTRQAAALTLKAPEPPKYDPPIAPVPVSSLKEVLERDLAAALKQGALAPGTDGGVAIGVVQHGTRRLLVFGAVKEDSIFEIGSISKTFTGLILAQMVEQRKVRLDEPVREVLPPGTVSKPAGAEITLLDLATQHSGLPRLPDNFHPADQQDPYADYAPANLYEFVAKHGVAKPPDAKFGYSNLGLGLLGQALSNRAQTTYPDLLRAEVTAPMGLRDTVVALSAEQQERFAQGHSAPGKPARAWKLDALAGAGAIRSTAADMLTYLEMQLHPAANRRSERSGGAESAAETLPAALQMSHELRADALPGMKIGLAWLFEEKTGAYWHNGATGGYSSYALFNPKEDYALVVLFNTSISSAQGSFADRLGEHISQRLSGKAAVSLQE